MKVTKTKVVTKTVTSFTISDLTQDEMLVVKNGLHMMANNDKWRPIKSQSDTARALLDAVNAEYYDH